MRIRLLIGLAAVGIAAAAGAGTSHASGFSPGFAPNGVLAPGGQVRYVARATQYTTRVEALRVPGRHVLRSLQLHGVYGVPMVTYGGDAGGLTRDGKRLVISTFPGGGTTTRFLVLDTRTLAVRQTIRLSGFWSFDALSPDGQTMFLIQFRTGQNAIHYVVRAYDLQANRLVKGTIADKSEPGPMTGLPMSRAMTADGTWAYTLYDKGDGYSAFIHALNTSARVAVCVDIKLPAGTLGSTKLHLALSADEQQLIVSGTDGKALLTVSAPR